MSKLTENTTLFKPTLVAEGLYLRTLPMGAMQDILRTYGETNASVTKDTSAEVIDKKTVEALNTLFRQLLVDSEGKPFTDLETGNVGDLLPTNAIQLITNSIINLVSPETAATDTDEKK